MTTEVMNQQPTETARAAALETVTPGAHGRHTAAVQRTSHRNGMNGKLPTGAHAELEERVLVRAIQRLQTRYAVLDASLVRRTVRRTYRDLSRQARLHTHLANTTANVAETTLRRLAERATENLTHSAPVEPAERQTRTAA